MGDLLTSMVFFTDRADKVKYSISIHELRKRHQDNTTECTKMIRTLILIIYSQGLHATKGCGRGKSIGVLSLSGGHIEHGITWNGNSETTKTGKIKLKGTHKRLRSGNWAQL